MDFFVRGANFTGGRDIDDPILNERSPTGVSLRLKRELDSLLKGSSNSLNVQKMGVSIVFLPEILIQLNRQLSKFKKNW